MNYPQLLNGLNIRNHKRNVYGIISGLSVLLVLFTALPAHAAIDQAGNWNNAINQPEACYPVDALKWEGGLFNIGAGDYVNEFRKMTNGAIDPRYVSAAQGAMVAYRYKDTVNPNRSDFVEFVYAKEIRVTTVAGVTQIQYRNPGVTNEATYISAGLPYNIDSGYTPWTGTATNRLMPPSAFLFDADPQENTAGNRRLGTNSSGSKTPYTGDTWTNTRSRTIVNNGGTLENQNGSIDCIVGMSNVTYSPEYTGRRYMTNMPDTGTSPETCQANWSKPWEIVSCNVAETFQGISENIIEVGQRIVAAIGSLFMPEQQDVDDLFGATATFFSEKLGFILFPFQFVIDLFAVFTNPPDDWCSLSSCSISPGTVFGSGELTINLLAIKEASEGAWTLLTTLARIGLVLALISGLHRKFEEVTHK